MSRNVVREHFESRDMFFKSMKKKETYAELLRKPEWQKKRLEIMQRDNFTCQYCGSKENELQVHHRVYRKGTKPWEYDNDELITLCNRCHEVETEIKSQHYETFKAILSLGREVGLSEQYIEALLSTALAPLAYIAGKDEEYGISGKEGEILKETLYGTQLINDVKVIFSNGINLTTEEQRNLQQIYPWIYDIYKEYSK